MSTYDESKQKGQHCFPEQNPMYTKHEIEEIVSLTRLELYNRDLPCGSKAIRKRLDEFYLVRPLPSEGTISRILARRCLTNGRTGCYQ